MDSAPVFQIANHCYSQAIDSTDLFTNSKNI